MKPVIGVMPLFDEEKDSIWMVPGYMEGIRRAGGIPLMVPLWCEGEDLEQINDICAGFLFTGGQDVDPHLYGEEPDALCGRINHARDELEKRIYIASEKDEKWLGIRQETKEARKAETDQIKLFVEYARKQGSQHADRYYVLLTKLINNRLGIERGGRDKADQRTLMYLKSLETVVELHLTTLMTEGLPYKDAYQDMKMFIEAL